MPGPLEEEEIHIHVYCFAYVGRLVGLSVCRSVVHMISADYLENHLSQSLHVSHVDWSWLVDVLNSGSQDQRSKSQWPFMSKCFSFSWKLLIIKFSYFTRCLVMTSRWFWGHFVKGQGQNTLNVKIVSADYLQNHLSKSLIILHVQWSSL